MFDNIKGGTPLLIVKPGNNEFMENLLCQGFVPVSSTKEGNEFDEISKSMSQQGEVLENITYCLQYKKIES